MADFAYVGSGISKLGSVRKWFAYYEAPDFNDSEIFLRRADIEWLFREPGDCVLKRIGLVWRPFTSGAAAINSAVALWSRGAGTVIGGFSSAADKTKYNEWQWYGALDVSNWQAVSATEFLLDWFTSSPASAYTNDAMWLTIQGEILTEPPYTQAQPVSLEGYKWPLVRR